MKRLKISSQRRLHRRAADECHFRPNARFWVWLAGSVDYDGYVKVTLRPGQVLRWSHGGITDEGYRSEWMTFKHEKNSHDSFPDSERERLYGVVFMIDEVEERDCDGRHFHESQVACPVDRLEDQLNYVDTCKGKKVYRVPSWRRVTSRQRDQYAEMAGY